MGATVKVSVVDSAGLRAPTAFKIFWEADAMVTWLVEFEGQTKPLDSVTDPAFQSAVHDSRAYVERALAAEPDEFDELKVIYFVDLETGLGFRFLGPPHAVNLAVDLVGQKAQTTPLRN